MEDRKIASKDPHRERLSRQFWLQKALEVLSREGESGLRIDAICKALGVTKGSFYWHFENRGDFLQAMLEYWSETYNKRVRNRAEECGGNALNRLRSVFEQVTKKNLSKYDVAFDAWAAREPGIADLVREVYRFRHDYVGSLFRELGFRGIAQETRTVAFLSFLREESRVIGKSRSKRSAHRISIEFDFFTRP